MNVGEKEVEEIRDHKWSTNNKLMFLTKWKDGNRLTWEPVSNFVKRYSEEMVRYAYENGLELNLTESLAPTGVGRGKGEGACGLECPQVGGFVLRFNRGISLFSLREPSRKCDHTTHFHDSFM